MTVSLAQLTPALILGHLRRWRRARRLGIPYVRRASFKIPRRLALGSHTVELALKNEAGVWDDFIGIFLNNMYMIEKLTGVSSVVDIGANHGLFSVYARMLYPHARIHAYEPNPLLRSELAQNCRGLNIDIFMEAVAATAGHCDLQPTSESNQGRIAVKEAACGIPVTPIAQVIERIGGGVDLLKLDCEGSEWDILTDAKSLRQVRTLTMEYHGWANGTGHEYPATVLQSLGFEVVKQVPSTDCGRILAKRPRATA